MNKAQFVSTLPFFMHSELSKQQLDKYVHSSCFYELLNSL